MIKKRKGKGNIGKERRKGNREYVGVESRNGSMYRKSVGVGCREYEGS